MVLIVYLLLTRTTSYQKKIIISLQEQPPIKKIIISLQEQPPIKKKLLFQGSPKTESSCEITLDFTYWILYQRDINWIPLF